VTTAGAAALVPEQITARSGSSFRSAFWCLSAPRRAGMTAIYAFCRVVDDAVDDACSPAEGEQRLAFWRQELELADHGEPATAVGRALQRTFREFGGSAAPLRELLLGMEMDLLGVTYADQAALEVYCHRVAAAVGHACLPVLGVRGAEVDVYAEHLGQALQLTNILRDLRADAMVDRIYVPREWLIAAAVDAEWLRGAGPAAAYEPGGPIARLVERLHAAAAARFDAAHAQLRRLPWRDRRRLLPARIMAAVYRELLHRLRRRGGELRAPQVSVPRWRKLWLLAKCCAGVGA
jgi:phytoene synthase